MRLLLPLVLLAACVDPVDVALFVDNDADAIRYVNGTETDVLVGLQEEGRSGFRPVWWSPDAACQRRCGAPVGQIVCALAAAEFSFAWGILPGDSVAVAVPTEPWVESSDGFGTCVRRTDLSGDLMASLCVSDSYESQSGDTTPPDETGPIGGFDDPTWLGPSDCALRPVVREDDGLHVALD